MSDQLAIIIISWNTKKLTLQAIESVLKDVQENGPLPTSIWVVDNASTDGTPDAIRERYPSVKVIQNARNVGFGAANNIGMREIGFGDPSVDTDELPNAVYLLNSDTITHNAATIQLYKALMNHEDAGVVGARLTYENGDFQHSAFAFPGLSQLWIDLLPSPARFYDSRLNGRYPKRLYQQMQPFKVGHTLGATMMLKREVIQQTGMFDEQFFMYAEEVDWSWRIQKVGWNIYCVPTAHVTHLEGRSTSQVKPRSARNLWESRHLLFQKHYPFWKRWLAKIIIKLGMRRKIAQINREFDRHQISAKEHDALVEVYEKVISL